MPPESPLLQVLVPKRPWAPPKLPEAEVAAVPGGWGPGVTVQQGRLPVPGTKGTGRSVSHNSPALFWPQSTEYVEHPHIRRWLPGAATRKIPEPLVPSAGVLGSHWDL